MESAHIANPEIPEHAESHGWTLVNGNLELLRTLENIMPDTVADLVKDINTVVKVGDTLRVKVINVDDQGRIKLSRKALLRDEAPAEEEETVEA